jgi:hypothetical protein
MDNSSIYFFPSYDGIVSQLHQINAIYSFAKSYNRSIVVTPFISQHYESLGNLYLCDYFIFPNGIKCTVRTPVWIIRSKTCVTSQFNPYYKPFSNSNINPNLKSVTDVENHFKFVRDINYNTVECIAGSFYTYPKDDSYSLQASFSQQIQFHYKYLNLYNLTKQILNYSDDINNKNFIVIHWRSHDELKRDCQFNPPNSNPMKTSFHCLSPYSFLQYVENIKIKFIIEKQMKIYIASQEKSSYIIKKLMDEGEYNDLMINLPL